MTTNDRPPVLGELGRRVRAALQWIVGESEEVAIGCWPSAGRGLVVDAIEVGVGPTRQLMPLGGQRLTIGRSDDNDLALPEDLTVSRHHAVLERSEGGWRIRDLRSSNGTFVNGVRVNATMRVNPGDRVAVGAASIALLAERQTDAADPTRLKSAEVVKSPFTERELEVLRLLAAGYTDAQLAQQLMISVKTVHSHLDRIRDKAGLRRRAELTRLAISLGLVT